MFKKGNMLFGILWSGLILFIIIFLVSAFYQRNVVAKQYAYATECIEKGNYEEAVPILGSLVNYKDSVVLLEEAQCGIIYGEAERLLGEGDYEGAIQKFDQISDYKDSAERYLQTKYEYAVQLFDRGKYSDAEIIFIDLGEYEDSVVYVAKCDLRLIESSQKLIYDEACNNFLNENYQEALSDFISLDGYEDSEEYVERCKEALRRLDRAKVISAGVLYTLAITNEQKVVTTGFNREHQSEVDDWTNIVSVSGFDVITIGLKADGSVVTSGYVDGYNIDTTEWEDIVDVAAGSRYVVGVTSDGKVLGQGQHTNGELDNISEWENVVDVAAGWRTTVGLTNDGQVYVTGYGSEELKAELSKEEDEWKDVIAIATNGGGSDHRCRGKGHIVGLKKDGTVVAVGDNTYGQLEVGEWKNIVEIAAGDWYTVGLTSDGEVLITGQNSSPGNYYIENEFYEWKNITSIAAGFGQTVGVTEDGNVVAMGFIENDKRDGAEKWDNILVKQY